MLTLFMYLVCKKKFSSAKELDNADKSALKLLEILFTQEELVNGNLTGSTTSKDERHCTETSRGPNLSRDQYCVVRSFRSTHNLKLADKNLGTVLLNSDDYIDLCYADGKFAFLHGVYIYQHRCHATCSRTEDIYQLPIPAQLRSTTQLRSTIPTSYL